MATFRPRGEIRISPENRQKQTNKMATPLDDQNRRSRDPLGSRDYQVKYSYTLHYTNYFLKGAKALSEPSRRTIDARAKISHNSINSYWHQDDFDYELNEEIFISENLVETLSLVPIKRSKF